MPSNTPIKPTEFKSNPPVGTKSALPRVPRGLGRGLLNLLQESNADQPVHDVHLLPLHQIIPNPHQPRRQFDPTALESLVASVKEHGIIQPILVRRVASDYEIIAGERRWRAAQQAGLSFLPCIIREMDDKLGLETALIENIQRDDLKPLEEAHTYQRFVEVFGYSHQTLAHRLGKSRSYVSNMIRLLNLPPSVQVWLEEGKLSAGHARSLLSFKDPHTAAQKALEHNWSVREMEAASLSEKGHAKPEAQDKLPLPTGHTPSSVHEEDKSEPERTKAPQTGKKAMHNFDTIALQEDLEAAMGGWHVSIRHQTTGKGQLEIGYQSPAELDALCEWINRWGGEIAPPEGT